MATYDELRETARLVEAAGRSAVVGIADVRDRVALQAVVDEGLATLGHLDVVAANAGIWSPNWFLDIDDDEYQATMDINVGGVWNTCKVVDPTMIEAGNGGSIVITSSAAGLRGQGPWSHYVASKHAVVGLMRALATSSPTLDPSEPSTRPVWRRSMSQQPEAAGFFDHPLGGGECGEHAAHRGAPTGRRVQRGRVADVGPGSMDHRRGPFPSTPGRQNKP